MTLEQYWSALLKRWKLIALCLVVVGLGAYIGSKLMTPVYQSMALIEISIRSNNNQADINSLMASQQLVQTEAELAISDPILREVASHYPALTATQLAQKACAVHRKTARLRNTANFGLSERYGHFDCV